MSYTEKEMNELSALGCNIAGNAGYEIVREGYLLREHEENKREQGYAVDEEGQPGSYSDAERALWANQSNASKHEDATQELRRKKIEDREIASGAINCEKVYDGGVDMEERTTQVGRKDLVNWSGKGANARYEFEDLVLGQARNQDNVPGHQMELSIQHPEQTIFIQFNERGVKLFVGTTEMDCKKRPYQTPDHKYKIREHLTYKNRELSRVFVVIETDDGKKIAFSHWKKDGRFGPIEGWWGIDSRLS